MAGYAAFNFKALLPTIRNFISIQAFPTMILTKEEFEAALSRTIDAMLEQMALDPDIELNKFYGLVSYLENLSCFGPVLYAMIDQASGNERP